MSKEQQVTYEPHPVTPERKAELRKQGYKIIDARFAPASDALVHDGDGRKGGSLPKASDKSATEVLDMAGGNFMAFKSAASKLLGDACPAKKPEIIAALEELATKPE